MTKTSGSTSSISGIDIAPSKLGGYEGDSPDKALNSKSKFGSWFTSKIRPLGSFFRSSKSNLLHNEQKDAQRTLSERRIKALHTAGDAKAAAKNASSAGIEYQGKTLSVTGGEALDTNIQDILNLADDRLVGQRIDAAGHLTPSKETAAHQATGTLLVVDKDKFKKQIDKDLQRFFSDTIRSTTTPHGLVLLKTKIQEQVDTGHIPEQKATTLNKQIDKQFEAQLKQFANYVDGIKPETDSPRHRYEAAKNKLEAVHEITAAVKQHNPSLLNKHRQELSKLAVSSFQETVQAIPSQLSSNLYETVALQDRVKEDRATLEDVLQVTSKKPEQRLAEVNRSTSAEVSKLEDQLSELPKISQRLEILAKDSVKELKAELSQDRELRTLRSRLETEQKTLARPVKGLFKSRTQKKIQTRIDQLEEKINKVKTQIAQSRSRADDIGEEFSTLSEIKLELENRYTDSLKAISPYDATPQYALGEKLNSLKENPNVTPFDHATVKQYFSQLTISLDTSVRDALIDHYADKITQDGIPPRKALAQVVNDSAFATTETQESTNKTLERYQSENIQNAGIDADNAQVTVLEKSVPGENKRYEDPINTSTNYNEVIGNLGEHLAARQHSNLPENAAQDIINILSDAYDRNVVSEADLIDLANDLINSLGLQPNGGEWNFEARLDGFKAGIEELKQGTNYQEAYDIQYRVTQEQNNRRHSDDSFPV